MDSHTDILILKGLTQKKGYQNHDEISRGLSYEGCKAHLFSGFILATDLASWRYKVVCREVTVVVVCVLP